MATTKTRRTAAEVAALKADAIQRKADVAADMRAQKAPRNVTPSPTRVGVGTIHQDIAGEKADAPLMGDVIGPLSDYVDVVGCHTQSTPPGRAFRAELHGAMAPDVDWLTDSANLGGGVKRPASVQPAVERPTTPEERGTAITGTKMTVTELLPGSPAPRWPAYVRVLFWPLTHASHFEGEATIELRHTVRPEDVPSFPDRVRVPSGTSFELETR